MYLSKISKIAAAIVFLSITGCSAQQLTPVSVNSEGGFQIKASLVEYDKPALKREMIKRPVRDKGPILEGPIKEHIPNRNRDGNNGFGNGDQAAPGSSCEHNNAENADC